jgi:hypothetical protein
MVAQTSNSGFEQWYRAKYGRPSPTEQARDYLAQAKEHASMVAAYEANLSVNARNQAATIGHCEYFAEKFNNLAVKSQELAQMHELMAKDAKKK